MLITITVMVIAIMVITIMVIDKMEIEPIGNIQQISLNSIQA